MQTLDLPRELERGLFSGQPWVYRNHVPPGVSLASGTWVQVTAGRFQGYGLWDESSAIALRLFSSDRAPDADWLEARVADAWALREPIRRGETSAYRLLFGEGDGLPGLTVDLYGAFAVVLTYAESLQALLPDVTRALQRQTSLHGVVWRPHKAGAPAEGGGAKLVSLHGRMPPHRLVVEEHGVRYAVDLYAGQKSGLFLDQRENRSTVGKLASGCRVLNLFSYTGGFSLAAALGGASHVTSVDVSSGALEALDENWKLNGLDPAAHTSVCEDAFEYLTHTQKSSKTFDLVICDPPSLAHSRAQRSEAEKAYLRLNTLGLQATRLGGVYATASCTAQFGTEAFFAMIGSAASRARRKLQIFHEAGHAIDHPILSSHPEGRYLKFAAGRVLPAP